METRVCLQATSFRNHWDGLTSKLKLPSTKAGVRLDLLQIQEGRGCEDFLVICSFQATRLLSTKRKDQVEFADALSAVWLALSLSTKAVGRLKDYLRLT